MKKTAVLRWLKFFDIIFRRSTIMNIEFTGDFYFDFCRISNIELHPAYKYFKQGIPIVIGSDDPFMFGSSGISFDFFEVIVAWNLDLSDVKQLIINSINYSALSLYEKEKAMRIWEEKWANFIRDYSKSYR